MLFPLREEGQGLVEYAMILIFIAIALIIALTLTGNAISNLFSRVAAAFNP
jgi:pilus assembly protein Flp/PilA